MHESAKFVRTEELAHLLLMHHSLKECAARLGITYQTVRKYASEAEFLGSLRLLSETIHAEVLAELSCQKKSLAEQMTEASEKALQRLQMLIDSTQEGIALKACDSVLDRVSETARNRKIEGDMTSRLTIDPVTLMHAALTAQELDQVRVMKSLPATFETDGGKEQHDG
jgi:DNA-binding transcriptional MerR regulator